MSANTTETPQLRRMTLQVGENALEHSCHVHDHLRLFGVAFSAFLDEERPVITAWVVFAYDGLEYPVRLQIRKNRKAIKLEFDAPEQPAVTQEGDAPPRGGWLTLD